MKILAGGPMSGTIGLAMIVEAGSALELDEAHYEPASDCGIPRVALTSNLNRAFFVYHGIKVRLAFESRGKLREIRLPDERKLARAYRSKKEQSFVDRWS